MNNSSHINDSDFRLIPRDEGFSSPEKLKRSEMDGLDASLWEELCIAAAENEQQNDTLMNNEVFRREVDKYKSLKLKSDQQVFYPNKNSLKKNSLKAVLWISVAAAVIALLIALPAILRNNNSDIVNPQIATIPYAPTGIPKEQESPVSMVEDLEELQSNKAIAQATEKAAVQPKEKREEAIPSNAIVEKEVETIAAMPEQKRTNLGLASIEPITYTATIETAEEVKATIIQTDNQNVVLFTSADEIERIEVERPSFFDRLREKSIVNFNKLRGEGTMVVREYDSNGKLTLYAVQSKALSFEKDYTQ
ncbi:MAG: hypothetical protein LBG19_01450 [Prevotellaceae bacterium]|jgi:hypothetical protein|nr:hypothetical protein [Prevotellaceae bacterium]